MDSASAGPVVLQTLTHAASQNTELLKPAEQQLKLWETQPGFHSILYSIISNYDIDLNVRWIAVLYFKNGIERFWRKTAPNAIPEDEKSMLRQQLIHNFKEPVHQIATQLAVLISKIARFDCPRFWPELIPTLMEGIKSQDPLEQQRVALTLHHVVKTLASKRLMSDRKVFYELAASIFSYVLGLWNSITEQYFHFQELQNQQQMLITGEYAVLLLKVMRKLACYGFREPREVEDAVTFIKLVLQRLQQMLECKQKLGNNLRLLELREKMVTLFTKVLLDYEEMHPDTMVQFLHQSLEMAVHYNLRETGKDLLFERFTVNSFNLVKMILRCENYKPSKNLHENQEDSLTMEAYKIKMSFFTYSTLSEILKRLVCQYLLLTEDDLQLWDTDPEEYIGDEGGDSWKFSLRPCAEVLFLTLFKEFRESLIPVLLEMVQEVQSSPSNPDDLAMVAKKDAVYCAVGLASFDLFDDIDFDGWFSSQLLAELQNKHTNYRIIRRRVIWLIGQWIGVKFSITLRPVLYQSLLPLLKQDEDPVVRIEAANTLKNAVDDIDFKTDDFMPFLESTFGLLFELLKEVSECETKMRVLHVMSFVIERVGMEIRPHAQTLIQYLPLLWEASVEHHMLRCAILTTLVHLVQGLGTHCVSMYNFLLPVIQLSTDMSQEPHVYLLEDGLELWLCTLHNSPAITPELLHLFCNMSQLLELGSENLRTCLKIIESYVLLGPKDFMQMYSSTLVTSLSSLLTDLKTDGIVMVMKLIELVFKSFPLEGPKVFSQMLPNIMTTILEKEEYPMIMAVYLTLVGRMILQNQEFFWAFLENYCQNTHKNSQEVLGNLVEVWECKLDTMTQPERRKLSAMALMSLITSNISVILQRFGTIINMCVEVLHDVCSEADNGTQIDSLVLSDDAELSEDELDTEHEARRKQLLLNDPVHTVSLKDYVISQLQKCQQVHGETGFQALIDLVDTDVYIQLKHVLK